MTELEGVRLAGEEGAAELAGEMPADLAAGKAAMCGVGRTAVVAPSPAVADDLIVIVDGWSSTAAEGGTRTVQSPGAGEKVSTAAGIAASADGRK
jgi:hypothetical protein